MLLSVLPGVPGRADVQQWTFSGPRGVDPRSLTIHPADPSQIVLLSLGEVISGRPLPHRLWRSADGGASWAPIDFDFGNALLPGLSATASAFHMLVFDRNTSTNTLWRSVDGGATWEDASDLIPEGATGFRVFSLDVNDPTTLFATTSNLGLLRSQDSGETWTQVNEGLENRLEIQSLAHDPQEPSRIYRSASPPGGSATLFISGDGGDSWQASGQGLPSGSEDFGYQVTQLQVDPLDPSTLYAFVSPFPFSGWIPVPSTAVTGIFRSRDRGQTWEFLPTDVEVQSLTRLVLVPNPRTLLLLDTENLYRSTDEGLTWTRSEEGLGQPYFRFAVAPFFSPSPSSPAPISAPIQAPVYLATNTGILRSFDGAASWMPSNVGLERHPVESVVLDPGASGGIHAASSSGAVFRTTDRGTRWTSSVFSNGAVLGIDPTDGSRLLAGTRAQRFSSQIHRSTDGGRSWDVVGSAPSPFRVVTVDPNDSTWVYAGYLGGMLRSEDGGDSWQDLPLDEFDLRSVLSLTIDPRHSDVYVATGGSGIYRSSNRGETWSAIPTEFPPRGILSLAIHSAGTTLLAGLEGGGLHRLDLLTAEWTSVPRWSELAVHAILPVPGDPALLYAGVGRRVFRSKDEGRSWQKVGRGSVSGAPVRALAVDPANADHLWAGTDAGLYEIDQVEVTPILELEGGRFRAAVRWKDFEMATGTGAGAVIPGSTRTEADLASTDSTVMRFFSDDNWELLLKVLDGRGINGHFWVFSAAATNVAYTITVTDTRCGNRQEYVNPLGVRAPATTDTTAFAGCASPAPPSCQPRGSTLCLGEDGRFQVDVAWSDFQGNQGVGSQVRIPSSGLARGENSGLFYFFDEDNWELLVKVLDGCDQNGYFWVFTASTTNVEYVLDITDAVTGLVRNYANPLGVSGRAVNDIQAFACGP